MRDAGTKNRASIGFHDCLHEKSLRDVYSQAGPLFTDRLDNELLYVEESGFSQAFRVAVSDLIEKSNLLPKAFPSLDSYWEQPFGSKSLPRSNLLSDSKLYHKLVDPFDRGFSIWYLVRDLIEIAKLVSELGEIFEAFYATAASIRGYIGTHAGATVKDIANANISYQFGISNLMRDTSQFLQVLQTWRSHYDQVEATFGIPNNIHMDVVVVPEYRKSRSFTGVVFAPQKEFYINCNVTSSLAVLHRTVQYTVTAPEFKSAFARLQQLTDSLGVLDLSAVWDSVVPFSFILDWFFNIREWLHRNMRPRLYPADITVLDYCESFHLKTAAEFTTTYYSPYYINASIAADNRIFPFVNEPIGSFTSDVYVRRRFKPPPMKTPSGPSLKSSFLTLRHISVASTLAALRLIPRP